MSANSTIQLKSTDASAKPFSGRYVVYFAGGTRPLISFSKFVTAEFLAIIFARLTMTRMEVFDPEKGLCYFVEPDELSYSIFINWAKKWNKK